MSDSPPYPEFVGADNQNTLDQALARIVVALKEREVQFLFGAGMSRTSQVPIGTEVLRRLLRGYFPKGGTLAISDDRLDALIGEFSFESVLESVAHMPGVGRDDLTSKLQKILLDPEFKPSLAHEDFVSLCWGERGLPRLFTVLTTNFDDLLEQALGDRAVRITERNAKEIRHEQQKGKIPVVHLHGVLDEEYQATESDVFSDSYRVLYHEFEVALHYSAAFVFVGYSMNDPDFRSIFMKYRDRIRGRKEFDRKTFVVYPAKDVHSFVLGQPLWEKRGVIWFPLTAEDFFAKLKHFAKSGYDEDVRKNVMQKYSLADTLALDNYIHRTADVLRMSEVDALQFLHEALPRGGGK